MEEEEEEDEAEGEAQRVCINPRLSSLLCQVLHYPTHLRNLPLLQRRLRCRLLRRLLRRLSLLPRWLLLSRLHHRPPRAYPPLLRLHLRQPQLLLPLLLQRCNTTY